MQSGNQSGEGAKRGTQVRQYARMTGTTDIAAGDQAIDIQRTQAGVLQERSRIITGSRDADRRERPGACMEQQLLHQRIPLIALCCLTMDRVQVAEGDIDTKDLL